jgi:hypothetical protein
VFASDAQALAAAKAAYEGYNAVSDQIAHDGGRNPGRIAKWVSKSWLPTELKGWRRFAGSHEHMSGETKIVSLTFQSSVLAPTGVTEVTVYGCEDLSRARLRDASNRDITPASRSTRLALELRFQSSAPGSTILVLSESEPWAGQDYCSS